MSASQAKPFSVVTPAKAGACPGILMGDELRLGWIPACAGMTVVAGEVAR